MTTNFPPGSTTKAQRKRARLRLTAMKMIALDRIYDGRAIHEVIVKIARALEEVHSQAKAWRGWNVFYWIR